MSTGDFVRAGQRLPVNRRLILQSKQKAKKSHKQNRKIADTQKRI